MTTLLYALGACVLAAVAVRVVYELSAEGQRERVFRRLYSLPKNPWWNLKEVCDAFSIPPQPRGRRMTATELCAAMKRCRR